MGVQKALISFVGTAIILAGNFGIELSPNVLAIINSVIPVLGTLLVWAIPNKTPATTS